MTDNEMLALGERISAAVIRASGDPANDAEVARAAILVASQLMMMGNFFAGQAGVDTLAIYQAEMSRAAEWHARVLSLVDATGQA